MRVPLSFASGMLVGACVLALAGAQEDKAQQQPVSVPVSKDALLGPAEPKPPAGQTYSGTLKCASCHFDQYLNWRKEQSKHSKAFDILPLAYREDGACLKCHTTGYGHPTGYRKGEDRQFAGIACESCHGPGSAHVNAARAFTTLKNLAPEQIKVARDTIYRMVPENICVTCHVTRAHGTHPEFKR